jgi:catechol 2,3-dioxygenase-like lactoylglutathione lyase family enzyme
MGSTLLGIDHVALRALDLAATEQFYGEILGLPVVGRAEGVSPEWDDHPWRLRAFALPSGAQLDFFEIDGAPRAPRPGPAWLETVAHCALGVRSRADLEDWRKRLEENGFPILEEQDHGGGRHSLYVRDPNGHYLELTCRG